MRQTDTAAVACARCGRPARGYAWSAHGERLCHTSDPETDCYTKETRMFPMPKLDDDGRDGTLFGQRVSAEFVMALIAKLGGRVEVNMFQEIGRMRSAGVRIIARPKFSLTDPDVYQLVDRDGLAWPPVDPGPEEAITVTVVQESRKMLGAAITSTTGRDDVIEIRPDLEDEDDEQG